MEVAIYTLGISLSAFLLFWVQPLVAKVYLPLLGGSPSVWHTCMVFFQGVLLCGYTYAHVLTRKLVKHQQILLHMVIVICAFQLLPLLASYITPPTPEENPTVWLLSELLAKVALPFFVISTSAPLLQRWFSHTNHVAANDPYFLYAASNLGSLLALLSFPFLMEPLIGNNWQSMIWSMAYVVYALVLGGIAMFSWRHMPTHFDQALSVDDITVKPTTRDRFKWSLLSFIPSSLLLGVTTTITTDITSTPLFWVIPLALYLATFIICFNARTFTTYKQMLLLQPFVIIPVAIIMMPFSVTYANGFILIGVHLLGFLCCAMVCHGLLYVSRPHKQFLTEYFLWIAIGGFLGGIFNSIIAPIIFTSAWEYPITLILSLLVRPMPNPKELFFRAKDFLVPIVSLTLIVCLLMLRQTMTHSTNLFNGALDWSYLLVACSLPLLFRRPCAMALQLSLLLLLLPNIYEPTQDKIYQSRNFFGILKIHEIPSLNLRTLMHGTTLHGVQRIKGDPRSDMHYSYYRPLKDIMLSLHNHNQPAKIAVTGLGAGTLACLTGLPNNIVTFYEIDPSVVSVANDPRYFSYLNSCPAKGGVLLGDARLSMQSAEGNSFDLIVLDAFSSDAVPSHLIDLEAMELYLSKLKPFGLIAFNISNRHIDLQPVLSAISEKLHLNAYYKLYISEDYDKAFNSKWVLISRQNVNIINTLEQPGWRRVLADKNQPLWTDDYSNIIRLLV